MVFQMLCICKNWFGIKTIYNYLPVLEELADFLLKKLVICVELFLLIHFLSLDEFAIFTLNLPFLHIN